MIPSTTVTAAIQRCLYLRSSLTSVPSATGRQAEVVRLGMSLTSTSRAGDSRYCLLATAARPMRYCTERDLQALATYYLSRVRYVKLTSTTWATNKERLQAARPLVLREVAMSLGVTERQARRTVDQARDLVRRALREDLFC